MLPLDLSATDDEILEVVHLWVSLLARGDFVSAFALTEARPHWSPEIIETVIRNRGTTKPRPDGQVFKVTPLEDASGEHTPRHEVERSSDGTRVRFDLPLNGEWSDLTATFDVDQRGDQLVLVLDDIRAG